ncbi:MAG: sigma 54-interacting transcriptional regulator, partial [Candidatus Nitrotoga sp.]|nr:sigma 54-interacting transcriptional regulator [Candidatus Nitrotoga sp.]
VKLLRVIQEKKVRKVGATQEEPVDVRIISATHNALAEQVQQGKFRQDLYYRLNVITLLMPPLRAMRDDIAEVASQFLARLCGDTKVEFASAALTMLQQYDFPGNVRELENIIERALALYSDGIIGPADLQLAPTDFAGMTAKPSVAGKYPLTDYLDSVERAAILEALQQTNFNRTAAAKVLGVTFRALRYRMDRLDITDKDE